MMREFAAFTPVIVTWEDAEADTGGQCENIEAALASYLPCIRKSIGFYVGVAEKGGRRALMIATDDDRENPDAQNVGGLSRIPVGMVISIAAVQRPTNVRRRRK